MGPSSSAEARRLALELGCASAGEADDEPPEPLDSAILFAPAGELVKVAASAADGQPSFWTVMGDPEGNEFCVLRGPGDGWRADEPLG